MPFAWVGAAASLGSLAGGISGMTAGNGQGGTAYVPTNQAGADNSYTSALGSLSGNAGAGGTAAGNVINNPYAGQQMQGAQYAGQYLANGLAPQLTGASSQLSGAASGGLPYAQSILQTGFDPQSQLYNQQQNQNQQQTLALENASGTANTPYGAGVSALSNQNFNTSWENQQLGRQQAALSSYGGYLGAAGTAQTTAGNLGNAGASAYTTGTGLPYSTYLGQQTNDLSALGNSSNLYGNVTSAAGNYLNIGQGGQQAAFNQNQIYGQQIGSGLQNLSSYGSQLFGSGNSGSGGSTGDYGYGYSGVNPGYDIG